MASILNATTSSGLVTSADNSGSLQLATNNGTTAVTIDTSQNVGIGLTPPVGSGNYRSLNVGATFIYGNTGLAVAAYNNNADINDKYIITGVASSYTQSSGNHIWYNAASGSAGASISFTEQARITSAGLLQFNSGYGSVATAYGCRAWVNFNGTGTVAIRGSGNVSSITDNGTGDYTVNLTTAMPDGNYSAVTSGGTGGNNIRVSSCAPVSTTSTSQIRVIGISVNFDTLIDLEVVSVAIFR